MLTVTSPASSLSHASPSHLGRAAHGHGSVSKLSDSVTYPTGTVLTMTCDAANRVTSIRLGADLIATGVTYHPSGQTSGMTYGNGLSTEIGFDGRGRIGSVTTPAVLDLVYGYDGADNVSSVDDRAVPGTTRTMTYDALDRLETVTADGLWGLASYQYDELGNRTRKQMGDDVRYQYDDSNRLVVSSEPPDHGNLAFTWDDAGRLVSSSDGVNYRYDGRGRRVQKAESSRTILYHYDEGGRIIAETLPDGTKLRDYVYLGSKLIALDGCVSSYTAPCNEREWYHTDNLGSALARTDMSGEVVARLQYAPWGEEWSYQGDPGDRQYNGRVYDPGTGFHDYGARMYWPQVGRFISADSYRGEIANPASLNRYSYVHNNPSKYTDPTGHLIGLCGAVTGATWAFQQGYSWRESRFWKAALTGAAAEMGLNLLAGAVVLAAPEVLGTAGTASAAKVPELADKLQSTASALEEGVRALPAPSGYNPWAGSVVSTVAGQDTTMYRVWGGESERVGSWLTTSMPESAAAAKASLALPPGNAASFVSEVVVPAGTRLQVGQAAAAFGQAGGGAQVQLLDRIPASSFGPGTPLH